MSLFSNFNIIQVWRGLDRDRFGMTVVQIYNFKTTTRVFSQSNTPRNKIHRHLGCPDCFILGFWFSTMFRPKEKGQLVENTPSYSAKNNWHVWRRVTMSLFIVPMESIKDYITACLWRVISVTAAATPAVCHPPLLCRVDLVCPVSVVLCSPT